MDSRTIATAVLGLASLFFIYSFVFQPTAQPQEVSYEEFILGLADANKAFVMMDLRGAAESSKVPIMSCGVDIAGSVALVPKNLSIMVVDEGNCIFDGENKPVFYCDEASKAGVTFQIKEGNSTLFYKDRIVIGLREYSASSPCKVSIKE